MRTKIVIILLLLVSYQFVTAQKFQSIEEIEQWEMNEVDSAKANFKKDSVAWMARLNGKLSKQIESIQQKAASHKERLKNAQKKMEKKEQKPLESEPNQGKDPSIAVTDSMENKMESIIEKEDTVEIPHAENPAAQMDFKQYIQDCTKSLKTFLVEDKLTSTNAFFRDFLMQTDDIRQYVPLKDDLIKISELLKQYQMSIPDLQPFVEDLETVALADSILQSPYDRAKRIDAQERMKNIRFMSEKQTGCAYVDSLRQGLDIYYLSTSNMMDLIQEIEDCHTQYLATDNPKEMQKIVDDLKSSIEFEARVANFRSVMYVSKLYDEIIERILSYDDEGNFVFQRFDMIGLETIKNKLEEMRNRR